MNELNPDNNQEIPLHRRIAKNLSNQVSSGKLKPGEKLPSERQIARQFQASRATVRTALQHLEQGGLIARRQRRSAVVAIRRNIAPYLRIACGDSRLVDLCGQLGEMQILPPRCQLQLFDLQQARSIEQLATQPAMGADVLICDLAYVHYFRGEVEHYCPLPRSLFVEAPLLGVLTGMCGKNGQYTAAPVGISPMLLYFNRSSFQQKQLEMPHARWQWNQLQQAAQRLSGQGRYGFQFRPSFNHLASLMAARGGELYQADGKVAVDDAGQFVSTGNFIHELLHVWKVAPILAKADQLNLFAEQRCAMAMDGFEMFEKYRASLGDNLGVTVLPAATPRGSIICGFGAVVLKGAENLEPMHELVKTLLSVRCQRALLQISGGLPVRMDLLNVETLQSLGVPGEVAELLLQELHRGHCPNLPCSAEYKQVVENLFLELWLGLDNIENICQRLKQL